MSSPESLILKSQANAVFELSQKIGFNPTHFSWSKARSVLMTDLWVSKIVHNPTGYYFLFDFHGSLHSCEFSPGETSNIYSTRTGSWDTQLEYVERWLGFIKRETEAPDLWTLLSQEKVLVEVASAPDNENRPFTAEEQEYIAQSINEIKEYLVAIQNLDEEQAEFVTRRLNYLEDATKRQGRQDWVNTAIGVFFTIVVGAVLAPDQAHELFRFVTRFLQHLFTSRIQLP